MGTAEFTFFLLIQTVAALYEAASRLRSSPKRVRKIRCMIQ